MKKVLITGATGFAGSHLIEHLVTSNIYKVWGTHVSDNVKNIESIRQDIELLRVDLLNGAKVNEIVNDIKPDIIFHLAAFTSVRHSFTNPLDVITNNTAVELNVLEAVKNAKLSDTKIIITSSAQVYGFVSKTDLPINEQVMFKPDNPYSVSKITQEYLALQYFYTYDLPIIFLRPFNHIGPRLSADISVSRFAKSIAEIEKGTNPPILKVGNMSAKRDFTDVRDMVQAYVLASEKCKAGQAYNIGTGNTYTMQEVLDKLLLLSKVEIKVEPDQSLFRPSDTPEMRADATKFMEKTGWKPEIPIEKTLKDTLDYWRSVV